MNNSQIIPVAVNKKAYFDYEIIETLEVGIVLHGHEVKSLRRGKVSLKWAYAKVYDDELLLIDMHIPQYEFHTYSQVQSKKPRRLLAHKKQIYKYEQYLKQNQSATLVPLKTYFKGSMVKVLLAYAKGKKKHDKRETLKRQDQERQMQAQMKKYVK